MSFSAYLVGTWEKRFGIQTSLQIINPTLDYLEVTVAFLDSNEEFLKCVHSKEPLSPNKLWEVNTPALDEKFGVVKIISHVGQEVKPGIVGFQRHALVVPSAQEVAFSEAPLAAVPMEYAQAEYNRFMEKCF